MMRYARKVKDSLINILCLLISFLTGRCSYDKFTSFFRSKFISCRRKFTPSFEIKCYNGKKILGVDEANRIIADAVESGRPFMAGRYGSTELRILWRVREDGKGFIMPSEVPFRNLCELSGFFPEDIKLMAKFADLMKQSTAQVDLIGIMFEVMDEWMLKTYGNDPTYCYFISLEPFRASEPWTAKLEGKKVVVIHPFKETIESQYKKREFIFSRKNILPKFDLRVVKAVQTIADSKDERFSDWFEALEYMYNEAMKEDFDVAIIGCGAYGFPLAAKIKQAGKIAVHMGGATQLLFGIKGARWENNDRLGTMKNTAWVRPSEVETPEGFRKVEGGCYW